MDCTTADEKYIVSLMNIAATQIKDRVENLGNFADIKSIECFETYSGIAENMHIKFTISEEETSGNCLTCDNSSPKIEDYDYAELTKLSVYETE